MKKLVKNILEHRIVTGLIVAVLSSIILTIIKGWWPAIREWISSRPAWLGSSVSIPVWLFLLTCVMSLSLIVALIIKIVGLFRKSKPHPKPAWNQYTEGKFFGVVWRWSYNTYGISLDGPFCPDPECDMPLSLHSKFRRGSAIEYIFYECDECGKNEFLCKNGIQFAKEYVKKIIERNVRSISKGKSIDEVVYSSKQIDTTTIEE